MGRIVTLLCCLGLATLSAENRVPGKGNGKGHKANSTGAGIAAANVRFGANDVLAIRQYYGAHPVTLPPGLQKKLSGGKPLPPGWQNKLRPFPSDIDGRLNPACGHCERGVIDGYGVIYDKKTAIILDIVQLAGDIVR